MEQYGTLLQDFSIENNESYDDQKNEKKQKLLRNEFKTVGKYNIPLIKKQNINLTDIELWGYAKTKREDKENKHKAIHFFTYDWLFKAVYEKPEATLEKLNQYHALLTPEFSLYRDMPRALQIYSTFKNRWCGAFWQKQGMRVIPTVCCAGEESYDFCFDGIEQGSIVAISTYRREQYKNDFMKSYNKMLEVIKPSAILCYGEVFPEMRGNIKSVSPFDYDLLIRQLGKDEFLKKYLAGELYPSN